MPEIIVEDQNDSYYGNKTREDAVYRGYHNKEYDQDALFSPGIDRPKRSHALSQKEIPTCQDVDFVIEYYLKNDACRAVDRIFLDQF